jgi:RNA polymerase sigma factor (sigma-70 family)
MTNGLKSTVQRSFETLFGVGAVGDMADGRLLRLFLSGRQGVAEAAFEALVVRHGPMVLNVCRNVSGDSHEAQDAFQATFLVFARKASSIRRRDSVGSWLYGVARRVAHRARLEAARRRASERQAMTRSSTEHSRAGEEADYSALHEEIDRLPERYRAPVVLCYLEGMTHEQASGHLRCPVGTVGVRLMRARERLRPRLIRRGLAPGAGVLTLGTSARAAAIPTGLGNATVRLAMRSLPGKTAAGLVSASVASLGEGMIRRMLMIRLKMAGLALLSAGLLVTGGGLLIGRAAAQERGDRSEGTAQGAAQAGRPEPRPPTPREEFEALLRKHDAPRSEYINNQHRSKEASAGFLKVARENPDDPVAVDALNWVVTHTLFTPMAGEAMGLLQRDHIRSERIGPIVRELTMLYGAPFAPLERTLRVVLAGSPHRDVRGWACLGLAGYLKKEKEDIERRLVASELFQKAPEGRPFTPRPDVKEGDLGRLADESAVLFERAAREYGDVEADGSPLGKVAEAGLYALRYCSVGDMAPPIEGTDIDGKRFRLSDHLGKVVVLTFSANWCGPCRAMYPEERRLVERFKDEPFVLLSVNSDEDRATLRKSIDEGEITWRCWWDGRLGPITRRWNIEGFPTVYIIDDKGLIRYRTLTDLESAVETLLKMMPTTAKTTPTPPASGSPRSDRSPSP